MNAAEIRESTLTELRAARTAMLSAKWALALDGKDAETRESAAKELLNVQHAIQTLENAALAEIADKLLENEQRLANGRERLAKALNDLGKTKDALSAIGGFVQIAAKVAGVVL